jgi:hypothetical protein
MHASPHSRQGYDSQSALPENSCFPVDQRPKPAHVARTVLPTNPRQAYRLNAAKLCIKLHLQPSHRPEVCGGKPVASDQRSGGQTLYVTCVAGCPHSRQLYAYKLHFRQTYDLNRGRSRQVPPTERKDLYAPWRQHYGLNPARLRFKSHPKITLLVPTLIPKNLPPLLLRRFGTGLP